VPGKRDAIPSEVVAKMIDEHRKSLGITPRKISDEEIVQRLVFALVNEGAHILEDGIASKSGDIDMVYLTGYGFPLWRGGPMHYAGEVGLFNVVQAMGALPRTPTTTPFWQPHRCWPSWPPKASSSAEARTIPCRTQTNKDMT
jgi:3-hydroxyacyl-CoA dehydrogenase